MWRLRWGWLPHRSLHSHHRFPLQHHHPDLPWTSSLHRLPIELQQHIVSFVGYQLLPKRYRKIIKGIRFTYEHIYESVAGYPTAQWMARVHEYSWCNIYRRAESYAKKNPVRLTLYNVRYWDDPHPLDQLPKTHW
jgi:hypothetical protein